MKSAKRPSCLRSLLLVAGLVIREIAWTRRTLVAVLLLLVPSALALVIRSEAPPGTVDTYILSIFPTPVVFLSALFMLFFAGSIARDSIDDRTTTFLVTRPLGRVRIVLGFWLGTVIFATPLLWACGLGTIAVASAGLEGRAGFPSPEAAAEARWRIMLAGLAIALLSGAYYTWMSLKLKHPTVLGVLSILAIDGALGSVQANARFGAPSSSFESLLSPIFKTRGTMMSEPDLDLTLTQSGALQLILIELVVMLILLARSAQKHDYISSAAAEGG